VCSCYNWTLAFFAILRRLTQKALQYWQRVTYLSRLLTGRLQQGPRMFVAVLTHDIGQRMHMFLRLGMVQAPLQKHQGEEDNGKPLFGRFVRLHPKVGQAQMLFDVKLSTSMGQRF
jgi:hypothetical protein